MTLLELYNKAEEQGIEVDDFTMRELKSASFPKGWIVMDSRKIETVAEEKVLLAHELGHCETGSFYNIRSRFDTKSRHEKKADKSAILTLIPEDELMTAVEQGCQECWELAEHFEVTFEFMAKAMEYWQNEQLARRCR